VKILICNVGSTSLKFRLFDDDGWICISKGKVERIGSDNSPYSFQIKEGSSESGLMPIKDYETAIALMLSRLVGAKAPLTTLAELSAVGFKVVHAKGVTGVQLLDERVIRAMEEYNSIAPAHNPPYIRAIKTFAKLLPGVPMVGSFETGFHANMPRRAYLYGLPYEWYEKYGIRRYGFHGASHQYVSERVSKLLGYSPARLITCHLGGSSSLCAIKDGISIDTSLGFSLQSGVDHSYRCGDIDSFIMPYLKKSIGLSDEQIEDGMTKKGGLSGISGLSGDVRDLEEASIAGNDRAEAALEVFSYGVKKYIGAYTAALGGVDVICFAGGIGENGSKMRQRILEGFEYLGLKLDTKKNLELTGEGEITTKDSSVRVFVVPTDEEQIVARLTLGIVKGNVNR
jgi:acetate kinase